MKDRIRYVCEPHLDSTGEFRWPADEQERNALASRVLGACVVAAMDLSFEPTLRRLGELGLNATQNAELKQLIADTVFSVVFGLLVKLDQFPGADLDLVIKDTTSGEPIGSIVAGDIYDLHDRLFKWLAELSDFPKEFGAEKTAE